MSKKASKKFPLLLTIVLSVLFLVIGFVGGVGGTYVIDKNTNIRDFKKELRWNHAAF